MSAQRKPSYLPCQSCGGLNAFQSAFCFRCGRFLPRISDDVFALPERRRGFRHELAVHGEASCEDSADKQTIFIENICARGIKFRSDQLFEMEQILTITVPLDGDCFVLLGRVCHSSQDSSEAVTGVQFVDVDPGFVRKVGQLCAAIGQGPELVFV